MSENTLIKVGDNKKILGEKLTIVSSGPGVYLMKDGKSRVIYVGKAKDLKKRLTSYFKRADYSDLKTGILVDKIVSFDTILTGTEQEALILEATLIRKYKPRYNIILKDDKKYPSIRIDINSEFPTVTVHRKVTKDGALYFGPYTSASAVHQTLKVINKTFKIRKCKTTKFRNRSRPCINYQIGLCLGPCCRHVEKDIYDKIIREIILFLKGRTPELVKNLKNEMAELAIQELFEEAAQYRDKIYSLEKIMEKQVVVTSDQVDRDVITVTRGKELSLITLLSLTAGVLSGTRHFEFKETISEDSEIIETFILQFYEKSPNIPKEIVVQTLPDAVADTEDWLKSHKKTRVAILKPVRGDKMRLLEMAAKNGTKELEERVTQGRLSMSMLIRLRNILKMEEIPEHIECFDNSNISGTDPVAAMVVFKNGLPNKSSYRKYKIRNSIIQDDYAYMAEILERRYKKAEEEQTFPDLLIVDGGKGQLNIAVNVLKELGLLGRFGIIGLAKKDEKKGEEYDKVYKPFRSNPVSFIRDGDSLLFLQRIRDEAHRFAITFHRSRRDKKTTLSVLDSIAGVGNKRKAILLRYFGSVDQIKKASVDEIASVDGINQRVAKEVFYALNTSEN